VFCAKDFCGRQVVVADVVVVVVVDTQSDMCVRVCVCAKTTPTYSHCGSGRNKAAKIEKRGQKRGKKKL